MSFFFGARDHREYGRRPARGLVGRRTIAATTPCSSGRGVVLRRPGELGRLPWTAMVSLRWRPAILRALTTELFPTPSRRRGGTQAMLETPARRSVAVYFVADARLRREPGAVISLLQLSRSSPPLPSG
jgi:hypothetical protein